MNLKYVSNSLCSVRCDQSLSWYMRTNIKWRKQGCIGAWIETTPAFIDGHMIFIHSIGMCRIWRFLAVLSSFIHSSLLCTFSCHPSPPTLLPSSITSSCHLFLGLPLNLIVPKFIYNTHFGILFSSILCTCPKQHNLLTMKIYKHRQNTTKFIIFYHFWTTCFDSLESSSGPLVNWSKTI